MSLTGKSIGIIGLGQMGGSLAAALKRQKAGAIIIGYDIKPSLLRAVQERKIIDQAARSISDLVGRSGIVIIATPISAIILILKTHRQILSEKLLVVDLGSIRGPIQEALSSKSLPNHFGLHFICGTNLRGQAAWNDSLFSGATCFLFGQKRSNSRALELALDLARTIKSHPVRIAPETHDEIFALTSGLPHILAFSLAKLWIETKPKNRLVKGPSFDSATRVASSDPALVEEILFHNRRNIFKTLLNFERNIRDFKKALSGNDARALGRYLKDCTR